MTRRDLLFPLALLVLLAGWCGWIEITGRTFLPRHPAARDLPWAAVPEQHEVARGQPFNRAMTDPINLLYPDRVFTMAELRAGRLPFWNPNILDGVPHLANPLTAVLYVPDWLWLRCEPLDALLFSAALHVWIAGVAMYAFLRAARLRMGAAAVGGLAFALSGWVAAHLHNTELVAVVAWIPLGLAGAEALRRGLRRTGAAAIAFSIALQWLAGFPQLAVYGTLAIACWSGLALLPRYFAAGLAGASRQAVVTTAAALVGLGLAAPQILPSHELYARSARGLEATSTAHATRLRTGALVGLALPTWLGNAFEKPITEVPENDDPDHAARWNVARLLVGDAAPGGAVVDPINTCGERTIFAGGGILVLAIASLLLRPSRLSVSALVLCALGLVFAWADPIPASVLRLTGLEHGTSIRAIVLLAIAIPTLAATTLDALSQDSAHATSARPPWLPRAFLYLAAGALVVAATAAWIFPDQLMYRVVEWLRAQGAEDRLGVHGGATWDYVGSFRPAFVRFRLDLTVFAISTGLTMLAVEWRLRGARRPALPWIALLLITAGDLGWFWAATVRPTTRQFAYASTPGFEFLGAHLGDARFGRVSEDAGLAAADKDGLVPPNVGLVAHLADAQGYRELVPARRIEVAAATSAFTRSYGISGTTLAHAASPALDLAGVKYLVAARPMEIRAGEFAASGLTRVHPPATESRAASDLWIYENPGALPRVFFVEPLGETAEYVRVSVLTDLEKMIDEGHVDPRTAVSRWVLPGVPAPTAAAGTSAPRVAIQSATPGHYVLDVTARGPGAVVVTETFDPGWSATRQDDGTALPIQESPGSFLAIPLARSATIRLDYVPPRFRLALGLLAGAGVIFLLLLLWPTPREKPAPVRAGAPQPPLPPLPLSPSPAPTTGAPE